MTREELFRAWTKLAHDVRPLGNIVQNPVEGLTGEKLTEWLEVVVKTRTAFEGLTVETLLFLTSKLDS